MFRWRCVGRSMASEVHQPSMVALRWIRDGVPLAVRAAALCRNAHAHDPSRLVHAAPRRSYREELHALQACLSSPPPHSDNPASSWLHDDALAVEDERGLERSIGGNLLQRTGLAGLMGATATVLGAEANVTSSMATLTASVDASSHWEQQVAHVLLAASATSFSHHSGAVTPIHQALGQIEACLHGASNTGLPADRRLVASHLAPVVWTKLFEAVNGYLLHAMRASTKEGEVAADGGAVPGGAAGQPRNLSRQQYIRERYWDALRSGYALVRLYQQQPEGPTLLSQEGGRADGAPILRSILQFAMHAADGALAASMATQLHEHGLLREGDAVVAAAAFAHSHRTDLCHWVFSLLPPTESTHDAALRDARRIAALAAAADANPLVAVDVLRELERLLIDSSLGAGTSEVAVHAVVGAVVCVLGAIGRSVSVAAAPDDAATMGSDNRPLDLVDGLLTTLLAHASTTIVNDPLVHEAVQHVLSCCCIVHHSKRSDDAAVIAAMPLRARIDATVAKLLQRSARARLTTGALVDAMLCETEPVASLEKLEASVKMGIAPSPSAVNAIATRLLVADEHPSHFFSVLQLGAANNVCNDRFPAMLATGIVHMLHRMASSGALGVPTSAQVRDAIEACLSGVDAHHTQFPLQAAPLCSIAIVALQQLRCWAWMHNLRDDDAAILRLDAMLERSARSSLQRWHRRIRANDAAPQPGRILSLHDVVYAKETGVDGGGAQRLVLLDDDDIAALATYCGTATNVQWDVAARALQRIVHSVQQAQAKPQSGLHPRVVLLVDQVAAVDFCWMTVWARALPSTVFDDVTVGNYLRSLDVCGGVASAYVRRVRMGMDGDGGNQLLFETVTVGLGQELNEPSKASLRALARSDEAPFPPLTLLRDPAMAPDAFENVLPQLTDTYAPGDASNVPWIASPATIPSSGVFVADSSSA